MAMLLKKKRDQDLDTIDIEPGAVTIMIENVNKIDTQTLILSEDGTMINEEDLEKFESLDSLDYHETDENDNVDVEALVKSADNTVSIHELVKQINDDNKFPEVNVP